MSVLLCAVGVALVLLVLLDFLLTTVSLRREGPLTELVSALTGRLIGGMRPSVRAYGGPITLSALAVTWIVGQWVGWTLVFFSARGSLVGPDQAPVVGFWDSVGFAGGTLSTLGLGVVTPLSPWVHVFVVLASVCGMLVLTLSVTYVINVSQVATTSRSVAVQLRDIAAVVEAIPDEDARASDLIDRAGDLRAAPGNCWPMWSRPSAAPQRPRTAWGRSSSPTPSDG